MISDEAVEAAARTMLTGDREWLEWDDLYPAGQDHWRGKARAALEAAAPYLMAQAWDEGRAADDFEVSIGFDANPYRSPRG